jgi:hypothetical protein
MSPGGSAHAQSGCVPVDDRFSDRGALASEQFPCSLQRRARLTVASRPLMDLGFVETQLRALYQVVASIRPLDGLGDEAIRLIEPALPRREHGLTERQRC